MGSEAGQRMEEDDDNLYEACVGRLCFSPPYSHYIPPPVYSRIPRREYRWKIGAKASRGLQCKISHSVTLPNILGLGPEARWRWQWKPVSLATSIIMRIWPQHSGTSETGGGPRSLGVGVSPRARFKVLTPVLGKLAVQPMVEVLPAPRISIRRYFQLGTVKLSVQANLEVSRSAAGRLKCPEWSFQVNCLLTDAVRVLLQPVKDNFVMKGSRSFGIIPDCKVVARGMMEIPVKSILNGASGFLSSLPLLGLDSLKVSRVITDKVGAGLTCAKGCCFVQAGLEILSAPALYGYATLNIVKASKTPPLSTARYLSASRSVGMSDAISVIPGHWIDPGPETGSPGERDFNMDVANMTEKQLIGNGWKVLRPDRDCPDLTWEEYLNWVAKQTIQGVPVLEIHGQGSQADSRGLVLGVIGDANAPLNKELANDFGYYRMDWTGLGVPKRGGAVLESFNADEVLRMAPWHRKWSVRRLATRIVKGIERASRANRAARGVLVDSETEDDDALFP